MEQQHQQLNSVRDLLPLLLDAPITYRSKKHNANLEGFVTAGGYCCACPAAASCGYRDKVLSALQFERHAGATSSNQNGHIFLRNGTSLYDLFHALRDLPADEFPELFREAVGLPMTVATSAAAGAAPAPPGLHQGQQPGPSASWEPNGARGNGVMAEPLPAPAPAPAQEDVEMLTEEEKASLCLLGLRENCSATQSDSMYGIEGPAAELIEAAVSSDHAMPDVEEVKNGPNEEPRYISLSTSTPVKMRVTETKYRMESILKDVRGLLSTGLLEGCKVFYRKDEVCVVPAGGRIVENVGRICGQGYSCGCSECNYSSNVMNACEFEQHYGQSSNNQNDHIFLETGISLYRVMLELKHYRLDMLGEYIEEAIGFPPNLDEYNKWKASFQKENDYSDAAASDHCSTQSSQESDVGDLIYSLREYLKESPSRDTTNLSWSASKRRSERQLKRGGTGTSTATLSGSQDKGVSGLSTGTSKKTGTEETRSENTAGPLDIYDGKSDSPEPTAVTSNHSKHDPLGHSLSSPETVAQQPLSNCIRDSKSKESKSRDTTLHPLVFKEGGLSDNTLLIYKLKNGEALKLGYKRRTGIVCDCCDQEFTPSQFEDHAGMGKRRQPYHNIYTSEGLTLHKLALQLQERLDSNGICKDNFTSYSDYPNLTSGGSNEPSITTGAIVPLKRTLQERVVETETCYICGDGHTTIGNIDPDTIVFCNQCERPCHIKCYNDGLTKKKVPVKVLEEYMQFCFLCCQKCQSLRACLDEGLENFEEITCLRQIRSTICWRLLSGMNTSSDVQLYMPQVIDIFNDAFAATTAGHGVVFSDMVYAKDVEGEKDFRGMCCAVLTASTHVLSTAILKVRTEQVAELVLVATRSECRKKGYFVLLLNLIESHLRKWNVRLLTAPVDPEMAPIWSEKLGFTILSAEEKKSMLESHPLVMFENLILVQKSLA